MTLIFRKAKKNDLDAIVDLLLNDILGRARESIDESSMKKYLSAFEKIDSDPNQYLMVCELNDQIVATCHLTLMPSLTFCGSLRLQIEAVRVHPDFRNKKIGTQMIKKAIDFAKENEVGIVQLTMNAERKEAQNFYEKEGFKATHVGFKLDLNNK